MTLEMSISIKQTNINTRYQLIIEYLPVHVNLKVTLATVSKCKCFLLKLKLFINQILIKLFRSRDISHV